MKFYSSIDFNRVWSDPSTNDRAKTTSTLFRGRVSVVWMFQAALEKQAGLRKQVASSQEFLCFCSSTSARHLHQQILSQGQKLIQNTPNVIIKTGNCFFFEGPLALLCWYFVTVSWNHGHWSFIGCGRILPLSLNVWNVFKEKKN